MRSAEQALGRYRLLSCSALTVECWQLVFVQPELAAEIEFRAWTNDGNLRHASFKGLRDAEDHSKVFVVDA